MVVEVSKNLQNPGMHYGTKKLVGIIDDVPDKIEQDTYYSRREGMPRFIKAQNDVYIKTKHAPKPKKEGVPMILKILGGVIGVVSIALWGKSIRKGLLKFIKNFPK